MGGSGSYVYAETSSPRLLGDLFTLIYDGSACSSSSPSPSLDASPNPERHGKPTPSSADLIVDVEAALGLEPLTLEPPSDTGMGVSTVTFYYHMYGTTMGELRVTNAAGEVVWSLSGDQGNWWQAATVDVYSPSFTFEYTRGNRWEGDAAVALVAVSCGAAPPPPPAAPPSVSSTGPCKAYGNCACSSNYDASCTSYSSKYKNNEECTVTFSSSAVLASWAFSTESGYDSVTVNGVQYSGSTSPDGVVASSMTWSSDGSVVRDGWKICQTLLPN